MGGARAQGRRSSSGGAKPPSWSWAKERPSGRLGAAILEPGEVCEGGRGRGAGSKGQS